MTQEPPTEPRPWDPDAVRTGGGLLAVTLIVSLLAHGVIPFADLLWPKPAISRTPVVMEVADLPLPPADELVESPDPEDVEAPPTPTDKSTTPTPADKPVEDKPSDTPADQPADKVADKPDDVAPPVDKPAGDEPPPPDVVTPPPVDNNEALRKLVADRAQRRAEWEAAREKRRAEREAARAARRAAAEAAAAARRGGAPDGASREGTPEPVHLCTATSLGPALDVKTERPVGQWVTILPTVFNFFVTKPGMSEYLDDAKQVVVPKKRIGFVDFAMPADVLRMSLEEPRGVTLALGRLDGRCMIGLMYKRGLFPLTLRRVPMRIVDKQNNTVDALVNFTINKDGTVELQPVDRNVSLPFAKGALKNRAQIERNIEDHFAAARLAKAVAEMFGFKLDGSSTKDGKSDGKSDGKKAPPAQGTAKPGAPSSSPPPAATPTPSGAARVTTGAASASTPARPTTR